MAANDDQTKTALDQAINKTLHDIDTARIMLFFAKKTLQQKSQEMQELLESVNHHIKTGGPLNHTLLMSIASLDRAMKREQRSSAPFPTWQRRLKKHVEKLEELKEMKMAEEFDEVKGS